MTASSLRNVVVVGGSFVGVAAAKELANLLPTTHRVLLIERHSHFHHLFAFPRFAIVPSHEHKAFIPYSGVFTTQQAPGANDAPRYQVIRARAISLHPHHITLDRDWNGSPDIPFDYLVVATGTRLEAPGTMPDDDKPSSIRYLQQHQQLIKSARSIAIVGGGAVGVQIACDLKEVYPDKEVTLLHSREQLMPLYHAALSDLIKERFAELGVNLVTGTRVAVPPSGFPKELDEGKITLTLQGGRTLPAVDFAILATGQTANNQFLSTLPPSSFSSSSATITNPQNGFIRVQPTLQFQDPAYAHMFAVGDIADTGAHKAAKPGGVQAAVAARNIAAMISGSREEPAERLTVTPPAIHLTLGLVRNVVFRNPDLAAGQTEPVVKWRDDGREDMGIDGVWERRGIKVVNPKDYHL